MENKMTTSTQTLNKDAYLALSNGNYASLEEAADEFISVLSEDEGDDYDAEALKGVLIATMNFLRTQRKLDTWLQKNVPSPDKEVIEYSLEVAETIGLTENVTITVNVSHDPNLLLRDLLNILYPSK
jgi:hypothetical protein